VLSKVVEDVAEVMMIVPFEEEQRAFLDTGYCC